MIKQHFLYTTRYVLTSDAFFQLWHKAQTGRYLIKTNLDT